MEKTVTMREVAKALGVSVATVSMSLRNRPNISAPVRARVRAMAEELGYRPHPYISALMRNRRFSQSPTTGSVLALVHGLDGNAGWARAASATHRLIHRGIVERARAMGYATEDFACGEAGMPAPRLGEILRARGIRGLLLGPVPDGTPPPELDWSDFAMIGIGVPHHDFTVHAVTNDHYFSSLRLMEECHRLGYRRPGLILRQSHQAKFQGRWEAGFKHGQQSFAGLRRTAPLFVHNLEEIGLFPAEEFRRWLARERPDAIVTIAPEMVERFLKQNQRTVPQDIGLASLSCSGPRTRISGIYQNGELIGATAVELLIARIERNDTGLPSQALATMIEGVWNPGRTLRAQPTA